MRPITYDVKCEALAEAFLADYTMKDRVSCVSLLAQAIQVTIEDWISDAETDPSFKEKA